MGSVEYFSIVNFGHIASLVISCCGLLLLLTNSDGGFFVARVGIVYVVDFPIWMRRKDGQF